MARATHQQAVKLPTGGAQPAWASSTCTQQPSAAHASITCWFPGRSSVAAHACAFKHKPPLQPQPAARVPQVVVHMLTNVRGYLEVYQQELRQRLAITSQEDTVAADAAFSSTRTLCPAPQLAACLTHHADVVRQLAGVLPLQAVAADLAAVAAAAPSVPVVHAAKAHVSTLSKCASESAVQARAQTPPRFTARSAPLPAAVLHALRAALPLRRCVPHLHACRTGTTLTVHA